MSQNPADYYQSEFNFYKDKLKRIKQTLFWVGMMRLSIFLLTALLIYILRTPINYAVIFGSIGLVVFLIILSKNEDIRTERKRIERLLELNALELRILARDLEGINGGDKWVSDRHFYNQDIDLFGQGSIFQLLNRTASSNGERELAQLLNSNEIGAIQLQQELIIELKEQPKWRQQFQTSLSMIDREVEHEEIENWIQKYKPVIPQLFKFLPAIYSGLSVAAFVAYGFDIISGQLLLLWFFVGILITLPFLKKVSNLYSSASRLTETFSHYSTLLLQIEEASFTAQYLSEQQDQIRTESRAASLILKDLSKELNSLDQRNNFLFAIGANAFLLWDLRYAYRIESWLKRYKNLTSNWFGTIAKFDAYNSLANYAFNYPVHVFPTLIEQDHLFLSAANLGHPLLKDDQRISNDVTIDQSDFIIITGANMAGKSTFLRTVALNLVLANVGLPVCASSFAYKPMKFITSMRTSDSLVNDESYFFSELKRLKFIVDELKKASYFIILDEILKGTNSKDKEEGSKKFVQKLVGSGSTGIIATHDLSLCSLSSEIPQIKNHYFDAEIVDDELYFDYRYKDGICQNMNASFLLRKMEIV